MEGATHFIEYYRHKEGLYLFTQILPIRCLTAQLNISLENEIKTIAIWYIKPKNNGA